MSKTYKGYELIKAIADREIKEGTYIEVHDLSVLDKVITTIWYENKKLNWNTGEFDTSYLCNDYYYFKLIEYNTIDIDNIEEIETEAIGSLAEEVKCKLNKVIKAVKQLNKEIKEIKEK